MFEKNVKYAYLVDTYGELLDEGARAIMEAYYNEDLSLSEIADGIGISRQGVRHSIKRSEELLDRYEACLHLSERDMALAEAAEALERAEAILRTREETALLSVADTLQQTSRLLRNSK